MELNSHSKIFLDFLLAQNQIWKMFAIRGKMTSTSVQNYTTTAEKAKQPRKPRDKVAFKAQFRGGENGRKFHGTKKWIRTNLLLANMSQIY